MHLAETFRADGQAGLQATSQPTRSQASADIQPLEPALAIDGGDRRRACERAGTGEQLRRAATFTGQPASISALTGCARWHGRPRPWSMAPSWFAYPASRLTRLVSQLTLAVGEGGKFPGQKRFLTATAPGGKYQPVAHSRSGAGDEPLTLMVKNIDT